MTKNQSSGQAIEAAKQGRRISRAAWPAGVFVFLQVPSTVPASVIPKMSSLPDDVKAELICRGWPLTYSNQLARVDEGSNITGWSPGAADVLALDWEIHDSPGEQYAAAPVEETAGSGTPIA